MCWAGIKGTPGPPGKIEPCYKCGSTSVTNDEYCHSCNTNQVERNRQVVIDNLMIYGFKKKPIYLRNFINTIDFLYIFAGFITSEFLDNASDVYLNVNGEKIRIYYCTFYDSLKVQIDNVINLKEIKREVSINKILKS